MKYKITVSALLREDGAGNEVMETVYLQVLDLDENPSPEIAQLLNPVVYQDEETEDEVIYVERSTPVTLTPDFGKMADELEPKPDPLAPKRTGRKPTYILNEVIDAFEADKPTQEIADEQGCSYGTIYSLRKKWEDDGTKQEPIEPVKTAYAESREALEATAKTEPTLEVKIRDMVREGLSLSELEMAFPSAPITLIQQIHEEYMASLA